MALITPAHVYKLLDKWTATYEELKGAGTNGAGDGTFGASLKALDIPALIAGAVDATFADPDIQIPLLNPAALAPPKLKATALFGGSFTEFFMNLSALCSLARTVNVSISNLDSFMSWYNYGNGSSYWQCLAPPDWGEMFTAVYGAVASRHNLYFPVVKDGVVLGNSAFTNALLKLDQSGPTPTDGYTVDWSKYSGGLPYVRWTGGVGSGAVSIVLTGKDQDGNSETYSASGTWGVGNYVATNTGIPLVPSGAAWHLITDATSAVITGMSAGICYFEGRPPAGRVYPPT